jgi:hypothetical protein
MAQNMWRHIKTAERIVLILTQEDICADIVGAPFLKLFDDKQADGADGLAFLGILQPDGPSWRRNRDLTGI